MDRDAVETAEALYLRKWESEEARNRGDAPNEIVLVREVQKGDEISVQQKVLTHPADIRIAEATARARGTDVMRSS